MDHTLYVYLLERIINSCIQLGLNEASLKSASFKLNCIKELVMSSGR
jgi:hypothetical protein